jgi:hypothetical protein
LEIIAGFLGVSSNIFCWIGILLMQHSQARRKEIPLAKRHDPKHPEEGFLYMQHYYATSWGDLLGISAIDWVVAAYLYRGDLSWWFLVPCLVVGIGVGFALHFFLWMGPSHKPDWAYPKKGVVSFGGQLHLVYFILQLTVALLAIALLVGGRLSPIQMAVGLSGGVVYLLAVWKDVNTKRWFSLPKKSSPNNSRGATLG